MSLSICDNQLDVAFDSISGNPTLSNYKDLLKIANTSVEALTKQNPSLLIFPEVLGTYKDGIEEESILNLYGDSEDLSKVKSKKKMD